MKTEKLHLASRPAVLALACMCALAFASCGDDDVPSIDEQLSQETTPVTFLTGKDQTVMFDYTDNWQPVGSDTLNAVTEDNAQHTFNLRQGKHNLVFARNVSIEKGASPSSIPGLHFDPIRRQFYLVSLKTVLHYDSTEPELNVADRDVYYWQRALEVSPYMLPLQQPQYTAVTSSLLLHITDYGSPDIATGKDILYIGWIRDIPVVESTGIGNDKSFKYRKQPHSFIFSMSRAANEQGNYPEYYYRYKTLCPQEGIDNIVLSCDITGNSGEPVHTTRIPKFSLRRGYTTILKGPLFTGDASDWTVEMKPYAE